MLILLDRIFLATALYLSSLKYVVTYLNTYGVLLTANQY